MSSSPARLLVGAALLVAAGGILARPGRAAAPRFLPDDPIEVDDDTWVDARKAVEYDLSEVYDYALNEFASPGDERPLPAVNVNTLGEVPDSSWFTNRIGRRPMPVEEIVRGPDERKRLDVSEWVVVRGKGPGGIQPGFRAVDVRHPRRVWQLEVDPPGNPEMATGAELIGTTFYHAFGYNVVEVYLVDVHPDRITIAPDAWVRDASGRRGFTRRDLEAILDRGARNADGTYRMSATRLRGKDLGRFQYHGIRPDDPNDIYPHEHRRELRGNRVFCAWLNHDDSRAVNTKVLLDEEDGRRFARHYMWDFGSSLGSATLFADRARSGHEELLEVGPSFANLFSLGFYVAPWLRIRQPRNVPAQAGRFSAEGFEPEKWTPEYPNAAFHNMQPEDAFWAARIVASFSDEAIRAIVAKARFSDPRATEHIAAALVGRRDRIARTWLNGVNPVLNFVLSAEGELTWENAAVRFGAATPAVTYRLSWSRFDNATDRHQPVGQTLVATEPRAAAPTALLSGAEFVAVQVRSEHAGHAAWARPVRAYFRRTADGWRTVGLER